MDIRVQELLEKIKKEGIDSADAQSAKILRNAEDEKSRIIEQAHREADEIIRKAKDEAGRAEDSGKAALLQASRDLLLAFRGELEKLIKAICLKETEAALDADAVKKAVPLILEAWAKDGRDELTVLLPEASLNAVESSIRNSLSGQLKAGIEIKPLKEIKTGFRIAEKDGAVYYDFSALALAEMLGAYMNRQLASIIEEAAR